MKIKLDENIPFRLAAHLAELGHDAHTVHQEGLIGHTDRIVFETAQKESRFFITQDLDFSDIRKYVPGSHCGILVMRLYDPDQPSLIRRITEIIQSGPSSDWIGCHVVATENKIRVVTPGAK